MTPISGPLSDNWITKGPPNGSGYKPEWRWVRRVWFRQKRPYTVHLPYTYICREVLYVNDSTNHTIEYTQIPLSSIDGQRAYNQAYQSFIGKMREDNAQLLALYGERKQAMSMITTRLNQLVTGLRAVRRGDLKAVKRAWGKRAGLRKRSKAAGDNILETCFGWGPLISDISGAVDVLTKGIPPSVVKTRFWQRLTRTEEVPYGAFTERQDIQELLSWQIQAKIRIENPDLLLAQNLGMVNLGSVLWELTPWSFVVDYFVNVNTFIGALTDFLGLEVLASSATLFTTTDAVVSGTWNVPDPGYDARFYKSRAVTVTRTVGIPMPTIDFRPPWRLSPFRALTSIGLLLQQIKGK